MTEKSFNELFERINQVIAAFADGKAARLAKDINSEKDKRNIQRYIKNKDGKSLAKFITGICKAYPTLNEDWLRHGHGSMTKKVIARKLDLKENLYERNVGNFLYNALKFLGLSIEEAATRTGIDLETLNMILNSQIEPSLTHLELFYTKLGINPVYFFDGNVKRMYKPSDPLLRVFYALDRHCTKPSDYECADIFNVSEKEAREFLKEWEEFQQRGEERVLPNKWIDNLTKRSELLMNCIMSDEPPFFIIRSGQDEKIDMAEVAKLKAELSDARKQIQEFSAEIVAQNKDIRQLRQHQPMDLTKNTVFGQKDAQIIQRKDQGNND